MRNALRILLIATFVASIGCDGIGYDLDAVELQNPGDTDVPDDEVPDADMAGDMPDPSEDMDAADADAADADGTDAADLVDMGRGCRIRHPLDEDAPCNPTETGECPENGICTLAVLGGMPPPQLACLERASEGEAGDGEACDRPSDCQENLACVNWSLNEPDPRGKICTHYCELDTGIGCEEDEFCTIADSQPPLDGIGWCTPTCDPYDAEACPAGQTCSIDYNYPAGTCLPSFRCIEVTDFKMEGDECGSGTDASMCVRGLTCYEVDVADFRCVKPCQDDSECTGTCGMPAGDWELRYCQSE